MEPNVETKGLSAGAIAGIVVGIFVIVVLVLVVLRRKGYLGAKKTEDDGKITILISLFKFGVCLLPDVWNIVHEVI